MPCWSAASSSWGVNSSGPYLLFWDKDREWHVPDDAAQVETIFRIDDRPPVTLVTTWYAKRETAEIGYLDMQLATEIMNALHTAETLIFRIGPTETSAGCRSGSRAGASVCGDGRLHRRVRRGQPRELVVMEGIDLRARCYAPTDDAATSPGSRPVADNTLTAGTARIDITPPLGFRMQGAMRRIEGAVGVEQPLTATALVLADDDHKVVILDCDLIGFDLPLAQTIRRQIADRVGTTTTGVTLGCTHTHNGPCTARHALGGPHHVAPRDGEVEALDHYIEVLVQQLLGVSAMANAARGPARVAAGHGHAAVAVNREEVAADGRVLVGRNPDGASDHAVDVLRVDDLAGNPIAAMVGYAAHPVVMGYQTYELSPTSRAPCGASSKARPGPPACT